MMGIHRIVKIFQVNCLVTNVTMIEICFRSNLICLVFIALFKNVSLMKMNRLKFVFSLETNLHQLKSLIQF